MHIPRERDPNLIKLEADVFGKMREAIKPVIPPSENLSQPGVKHISLEDAIRELSSLDSLESTDDKS